MGLGDVLVSCMRIPSMGQQQYANVLPGKMYSYDALFLPSAKEYLWSVLGKLKIQTFLLLACWAC
jgi:hypothetical protein